MTIKLTSAQQALLRAAAAAETGAVDASPETRATAASLVKRGCLISLPQAGGPSRLVITEAGRTAVDTPPGSDQRPKGESADKPELNAEAVGDGETETPAGASPRPPATAAPATRARSAVSKLAKVEAMLRRPGGATVGEIMATTGWQAHSVRGAMSGALKKQRGLAIVSEKTGAGRIYRIPGGKPAEAPAAGGAAA